jgi:hypothetical protein
LLVSRYSLRTPPRIVKQGDTLLSRQRRASYFAKIGHEIIGGGEVVLGCRGVVTETSKPLIRFKSERAESTVLAGL